MTSLFDIEIPGLPRMTNNSGRTKNHWRHVKAERDKWKSYVACAAIAHKPRGFTPMTKARVRITRYSSSEPDFDGLVSGGKALLDGLVEGGIIKDDKPSIIGQPEYRWEKAKPGKGKIRIEVWSA